MEPRTYSSLEVCQLAGLTYRQLDYWVRSGKVPCSENPAAGSGRPRCFSEADVAAIRAVAERRRQAAELLDWDRQPVSVSAPA